MTDIGIITIDVVFRTGSCVAAMSCLAYSCISWSASTGSFGRRFLHESANPAAQSGGAVGAARGRTVRSLRPSVARHHVASS